MGLNKSKVDKNAQITSIVESFHSNFSSTSRVRTAHVAAGAAAERVASCDSLTSIVPSLHLRPTGEELKSCKSSHIAMVGWHSE